MSPAPEVRHLQSLFPNDFESRATIGGRCNMDERQLQPHIRKTKAVNLLFLLGFSPLFRIFAF
ncbi:hypothetical protein JCM6292_1012 [Bacteroides pyogenes JCM 6292]|uniref:Uncharacterized protein n=2 Tax=Bacteroides pyogenes TaxID=310300 RepID=W4PCS2_9BACE|nr:hypothetical protein JCM6292_1012 [Bacteroides pyogenes JCM 6292]GAE17562.1 hypothetical protein JCM6294_328 [Bacteroides pyogenes DSM 20611 = JCM 6294]